MAGETASPATARRHVRINDLCRLCSRVFFLTVALVSLTWAFFFSRTSSNRYRRPVVLGICLVLIFKFLIWDHWLSTPLSPHRGASCLHKSLTDFSASLHHGDAAVLLHGQFGQKAFAPFVGNGHMGVSLDEAGIWLAHNDTFVGHVPFSFLLSFAANGLPLAPGATVIDFREAVVHRIFAPLRGQSTECWWIRQSVFVHRASPDVIAQKVLVVNKGSTILKVAVHPAEPLQWQGAAVQKKTFPEKDARMGDSDSYVVAAAPAMSMASGPATAEPGDVLHAAVASVKAAHSEVSVQPGSKYPLVELVTIVLSQRSPAKELISASRRLAQKASTRLLEVAFRPATMVLQRSHRVAWSELWSSHISIVGLSHPNTPSNEDIAAAMYYVLSCSTSFHALDLSHYRHRGHVHRDLNDTERLNCFSGPPTMHTASLWRAASSVATINALAQSWYSVLVENGCLHFVEAGALLLGQAMVLSFCTLRHAGRHMELALNPSNVLADVVLHNVKYDRHAITLAMHTSFTGGLTRLAISATDGLAFVPGASMSSRSYSKSPVLFACPSRCADQPHVLNSHETVLPVIVTNPVTPVLYISTSERNLIQLQQNFAHVQEAHVAVHRPISSLRHLKRQRPIVWIGITLFIIIFHVFVVALLIVECRGQKDIYIDDDPNSFLNRRRRFTDEKLMVA